MKSSSNSSNSSENIFTFESLIARAGRDHRGRDDSLFICTGGPLSPRRIEIPRFQTELVQQHKATCEKCSRIQREEQEQKQLSLEGPRRLEYILHVVGNAKLTVDYAESKKVELEQKRERGEEPDSFEQEKLRLALYDGGAAQSKILKERQELYRLLYSESNEVIRAGAKEAYERYVDAMKKLNREKEMVTPLNPSQSSLKRSLQGLS